VKSKMCKDLLNAAIAAGVDGMSKGQGLETHFNGAGCQNMKNAGAAQTETQIKVKVNTYIKLDKPVYCDHRVEREKCQGKPVPCTSSAKCKEIQAGLRKIQRGGKDTYCRKAFCQDLLQSLDELGEPKTVRMNTWTPVKVEDVRYVFSGKHADGKLIRM